MVIYVSLSGGIDSTATLLKVIHTFKEEEIKGVFMDTRWEAPEVYEYLSYLEDALGIEIVHLSPDKGMLELIEKYKKFPTFTNRFCTGELKRLPFYKFLKSELKYRENILVAIGVRKDESRFRKKKYSEVLPTEVYDMSIVHKTASKYILDKVKVLFPIIDWTREQCVTYIVKNQININPIYEFCDKCGCFPCFLRSVRKWTCIWNHEIGRKNIETLFKIEENFEKEGVTATILPNKNRYDIMKILENNNHSDQLELTEWL